MILKITGSVSVLSYLLDLLILSPSLTENSSNRNIKLFLSFDTEHKFRFSVLLANTKLNKHNLKRNFFTVKTKAVP